MRHVSDSACRPYLIASLTEHLPGVLQPWVRLLCRGELPELVRPAPRCHQAGEVGGCHTASITAIYVPDSVLAAVTYSAVVRFMGGPAFVLNTLTATHVQPATPCTSIATSACSSHPDCDPLCSALFPCVPRQAQEIGKLPRDDNDELIASLYR